MSTNQKIIAKTMNLTPILFTALCLAIAGCGEKSADKTPIQVVALEAPKTPPITPDDWKKAVEATYEKTKVKDEGGGIESFVACFEPNPEKKKKCTIYAIAERDTFRKLRIYTPGFSVMFGSNVSSYISLPDNKEPVLFLAPYIFSHNSWMFIKKLAIMVDGEVVLEKDLNDLKADREVRGAGVQERVDFIATPDQIEALRKIKPESKIIIRITGEKGYITLEKDELSRAKDNLIYAVDVYDRLNNAVKNKIPPQQEIKI